MGATSEQPGRRATAKAHNRRRLLDAAADHLVRHGAGGPLLEEIAAQADLTKGAIYSIFKSKHGLLSALMADLVEQEACDMAVTPYGLNGDDRDLATALADYGRRYGDVIRRQMSNAALLLELELLLHSARSEAAAQEFPPRAEARVSALAGALAGRPRPDGTPLTSEHATVTATVVIAAMQGLAQHNSLGLYPVPVELFAGTAATLAALPVAP
ncbi:TetR/AcrR family transcriptional regulator [Sinosporangium siamense]|uniref:TetR family transcriptional regulator n=1 Tax=Sinosporangium siamense TaxID=1367973 RepID=A0A919RKD6_9ACTN|nr:TetR/AcrR family transcriptional regulator [Sinosporangium siamense]GII95455.1 TetR family transcriptional regulator [Sinosporangium siamense]